MSRALPTTQALSFLRSARRAPPPPSGSVSFGCSAPPLPPGSQTLFGGGANSMSGTGGFTFGSFANNAPTSGFAGHTQSDGITFDNVIEQGNYSTRTPLKKDTKKDSTPKEFKANRPFIIILQSKLHDEIVPLFIGKVTAPVY